jgi:shikimate kinase
MGYNVVQFLRREARWTYGAGWISVERGVKHRIILIGFSATGKSTVGRRLAQRLGWSFVDTDVVVVEKTGKTIGELIHGEGEDSFRGHERRALVNATRRKQAVIASGGGAVLFESNRQRFARTCFIVCLEARPETIHQRLLLDAPAGTNPIAALLTQREDAVEHIAYLKQFRQPYYAVADWTVHTDYLSPDDVVEEIVHGWRFYEQAQTQDASGAAVVRLHYPLGDAWESDAPYRS